MTRRLPPHTQSDLSLDQFDAALSEHLGEDIGFADRVRRLAIVRGALAPAKKRRAELKAVCDAAHNDRQQRRAGQYLLRPQVRHTPARWSVGSQRLREAKPDLWQRCLIMKPYVKPEAPAGLEIPTPELWIAPAPTRTDATEDVAHRYVAMGRAMKPLIADEAEHVAALKLIANRAAWDGLPYRFADGWWIQTAKMEYDDGALRRIDPDTFTALAVEIPGKVTTVVTVREYDPEHDASEDDEADEAEGDGRYRPSQSRSAWGRTYNG